MSYIEYKTKVNYYIDCILYKKSNYKEIIQEWNKLAIQYPEWDELFDNEILYGNMKGEW